MSSPEAKADNPHLAHHFESLEQQEESCTLGMWLFLAQEVMFFGGLFMAYSVYRYMYPEAWFVGSHALSIPIGSFNTVVLLLSSFTMAMGVYFCQIGNSKWLFRMLLATLILGIVFVVLKWNLEYVPKFEGGVFPGKGWGPSGHHYGDLASFEDQGALQIFFFLYFVMTGMHAFHMLIGFVILGVLMVMTKQNKFGPHRYMPILFFGLYWHFVDIVWVFLFPMFYLVT